jgi:uncharacterized membrane protein
VILGRRADYSRLEAFSDIVIAFACVRLLLSLDVPRGYDELVKNVTGFIPFAVTFAALLLIWVAHRNLFRRYPLDDAFTLVVNGLFLFTIVFYAFPLKFIAGSVVSLFLPGGQTIVEGEDQLRNVFMIYGLGWSTIFFCIALLYFHAARERDELALSEIEAYDAVSDGMYYMCFVVGGALSVALADFNIGVEIGMPAVAYLSIGVLAIIVTWWRRRNRPDSLEAALSPATTAGEVFPEIPDD